MAKRESLEELKKRTRDVIRRLKRAYPGAKCSLNHSNPFELLIATILSAQCTDERVNIVTADLFRKYTKPEDYLKVAPRELEKDIQSTGFFRNKTKSIQGTSRVLTEQYQWRSSAHDGRVARASRRGTQDCECRARKCVRYKGRCGCRHARDAALASTCIHGAEDCGKDRTGPDSNRAEERLGDLPAPDDLSRPQDLQSAQSTVRGVHD